MNLPLILDYFLSIHLKVARTACAELTAFYTNNALSVIYPLQEVQVNCMTYYHFCAMQVKGRSHRFCVKPRFHYNFYSVDMVLVGTRRISEKQPKAELPSKTPSLTFYQVHWIWLSDLPLRPCLETFEVFSLKINPFRKMIVALKCLTMIIWNLCIIYYEKSIFVRNY